MSRSRGWDAADREREQRASAYAAAEQRHVTRWSEQVEQFRILEGMRAYRELLVEQHGVEGNNMLRAREAAALAWVLDIFAGTEELGADVRRAREMVAKRPPRIAPRDY